MDLSPTRFEKAREAVLLSAETAVLLAGMGARQAASATARAQAGLAGERRAGADPLFAPPDGCFNGGVARGLAAARTHAEPLGVQDEPKGQ